SPNPPALPPGEGEMTRWFPGRAQASPREDGLRREASPGGDAGAFRIARRGTESPEGNGWHGSWNQVRVEGGATKHEEKELLGSSRDDRSVGSPPRDPGGASRLVLGGRKLPDRRHPPLLGSRPPRHRLSARLLLPEPVADLVSRRPVQLVLLPRGAVHLSPRELPGDSAVSGRLQRRSLLPVRPVRRRLRLRPKLWL